MVTVNMHEAKTRLSSLVEGLETGRDNEIVLARNGKPVARLVAYSAPKRFGAAHHILAGLNLPETVEEFNAGDAEIAADFAASGEQDIFP
ncbi:type II toxin-antitoxin system Phd/YefM family antitoxin [Phyllobacterium calauticae]|jgi:antitoxin (DNA-binding transcriptional repressor) of toxin-antitoxin stability system|uniref:type II toxin-antitoxin system Phd/YefM family antitoxin n=1 Tax=Phyllobacterium calauticae TaxID=2817027 RepID=UPI001CBB2030|nr:type II toxin-antitoxin system Phd/YefM family antitoxin [Phyllobacterium calauticae]MBZ3692184.1 type II toxin-antitoxin system Phd/YefM family antitoxin [Phyllobacterium calauticae]